MRSIFRIVAVGVAALLPVSTLAQDEVIRISADSVTVPVSVLDRNGRYIANLKREDFKIFEAGVEQEITSFETVDGTVTILMLIERTGAIGLQLPRVVAAANAFVRQMRPEDRLIAMTFGSDAETVIDNKPVKEVPRGIRVGRTVADKFGVQLYGSVDAALKKIDNIPGRKAVVLFSEGSNTDRYSRRTARDNQKEAEESGATFYTIKFDSVFLPPGFIQRSASYQKRTREAHEFMSGLASKTGGRAFRIEQIEDLDATFAEVARELVRQYTLGYSPDKPAKPGERRKIQVRVNVPDAAVRARKEVVYR